MPSDGGYEVPISQSVPDHNRNPIDRPGYMNFDTKQLRHGVEANSLQTSTPAKSDAPTLPQRSIIKPQQHTSYDQLDLGTQRGHEELSAQSSEINRGRIDSLMKTTVVFGLIFLAIPTAAVVLYFDQQSNMQAVQDALTKASNQIREIQNKSGDQAQEHYVPSKALADVELRIMQLENISQVQAQRNALFSQTLTEFVQLKNTSLGHVRRIDELSNSLSNSNQAIQSLERRITDICPIKYNNKCFWVGGMEYKKITLSVARSICEAQNGRLADIYSREHYFMLMGYLRIFSGKDGHINAWTGMTYDNKNRKVLLSNGTNATFYHWKPDFPYAGYCCAIILRVTSDYNRKEQHLHNANSGFLMSTAMCEK